MSVVCKTTSCSVGRMDMEFTQQLIKAAKDIQSKAVHCKNEEMTKQFLVLPFIRFLGYDILDPQEVLPEHHADFSDTHKNRVDYAICSSNEPVIGIEVKLVGSDLDKKLGQIKGYFNAVPSIKMGIITDGMKYLCFADTIEKNIMDDREFMSFSLAEIGEGKLDDFTINGIRGLRKEAFDPDKIGATARENLMLTRFQRTIESWSADPSDELVRLLLKDADYDGRLSSKVIEDNKPLAVQAFSGFLDKNILERIGFSDRDLVKIEKSETKEPVNPPEAEGQPDRDWAIPTETEEAVFEFTTRRLAFLFHENSYFKSIDFVQHSALKHTFIVYYKKRNQGRIFNFRAQPDGDLEFTFPDMDEKLITRDLHELDPHLLRLFEAAVKKLS